MAIGATYHIMRLCVNTSQTGDESEHPMEGLTSIVYYQMPRDAPHLAVVRYTAYGYDGVAVQICEDIYQDNPDDFCRLEEDIETALQSGIDTCISSHHEYEFFPVINAYLTT